MLCQHLGPKVYIGSSGTCVLSTVFSDNFWPCYLGLRNSASIMPHKDEDVSQITMVCGLVTAGVWRRIPIMTLCAPPCNLKHFANLVAENKLAASESKFRYNENGATFSCKRLQYENVGDLRSAFNWFNLLVSFCLIVQFLLKIFLLFKPFKFSVTSNFARSDRSISFVFVGFGYLLRNMNSIKTQKPKISAKRQDLTSNLFTND